MTDPRGHVRPGQPIAIAASQLNWVNQQMRLGDSSMPNASGQSSPYTWVYAKNTGATVSRWAVLAITGVVVTPTGQSGGATAEFERMPVLTAGEVAASTTGWCVAVEPIAANAIGRVAIAGAVQVKASDLPKVARSAVLWKNESWALIIVNSGTRLGTVAQSWNKGATATVTEQNGDGSGTSPSATFTATNYFSDVTVDTGTKRVACAQVGSTWILIAAECA